MTAIAPNQSMRTAPWGWRGMCRNRSTIASATRPIGTLMRNTQRQPARKRISGAPANRPPTSGPITEEIPKTARK